MQHEARGRARLIGSPRRLLARARIDQRERRVRQQRAAGEKQRAGRRAAGDQIDVARAQRLEHQPAEARPRGDHLDGERSAQQRADDQAVDGGDRAAAPPSARRARRRASAARRARAPPARTAAPITSRIACACSRSNIAASGSASASAGTTRWRSRSSMRAARRIGRPIASRRSATSRCARRRRPGSSDVSSGGIDSSTTDAGANQRRTARRRGGCPLTTPSGRPTSGRDDQRGDREDRGVGGALGNQIAHRPVVGERAAEVEPQRAGQPVAVLRADRPIEAVARAQLARCARGWRRCRASRWRSRPAPAAPAPATPTTRRTPANSREARSRRDEVARLNRTRRHDGDACPATTAAAAARTPSASGWSTRVEAAT